MLGRLRTEEMQDSSTPDSWLQMSMGSSRHYFFFGVDGGIYVRFLRAAAREILVQVDYTVVLVLPITLSALSVRSAVFLRGNGGNWRSKSIARSLYLG